MAVNEFPTVDLFPETSSSYTDPRLVNRDAWVSRAPAKEMLSEAVSHGRDLIKKNKSWQTVLSPEQSYQPMLARKARCVFTHAA